MGIDIFTGGIKDSDTRDAVDRLIQEINSQPAPTASGGVVNNITQVTQQVPLPTATISEMDSSIRIAGFTTPAGTTNTQITSLSNPSFTEITGDAFTYVNSASQGDSIIINKDGIYNFSFSADMISGGGLGIGFSLNASGAELSTSYASLPASKKLTHGYDGGGSWITTTATSVSLKKDDVVRLHRQNAGAISDTSYSVFTASNVGKLKQAVVNTNSKITIPTSELILNGSTTRGTTATWIARFNDTEKIRGDAFTVESDAALGTRITMKKAGLLNASLEYRCGASAATAYLTKNQVNLTTAPMDVEAIAADVTGAASWSSNAAGSTFVNVGDVIRACLNNTVIYARLMLTFQEQDIQVSVSNTLPQFSDSDSSVRVVGASGYGATNTGTRVFTSVVENIGTDITFTNSGGLGSQFRINTPGLYHMTYSDGGTNQANMAIMKNEVALVANNNLLAHGYVSVGNDSISVQAYLMKDDIIRACGNGANGTSSIVSFAISKAGRPNVTGVNVTPFVNIPQPSSQSYQTLVGPSTYVPGVFNWPSFNNQSGNGLLTYSAGTFTAIKKCKVFISTSMRVIGAGVLVVVNRKNGVDLAVDSLVNFSAGWANATDTVELNIGDTLQSYHYSSNVDHARLSLFAEALSDQILTTPETFSTDTTPLVFATNSQYSLSTLTNAPVGTFITFWIAANNNGRNQCANAPTQSVVDMNANGIMLTCRAYNATSTQTEPAVVAIQIGKGWKNVQIRMIKQGSSNKPVGSLDIYANGTYSTGLHIKEYNENTGVVIIDAALSDSAVTSRHFQWADSTISGNGWFKVEASKSPALVGITNPVGKVAKIWHEVAAAASYASVAGSWQTIPLSIASDPFGIAPIASNRFTLTPGIYEIEGSASLRQGDLALRVRNVTDNITVGWKSGYSANGEIIDLLAGGIASIATTKSFELQYWVATAIGYGVGTISTNTGEPQRICMVTIRKLN